MTNASLDGASDGELSKPHSENIPENEKDVETGTPHATADPEKPADAAPPAAAKPPGPPGMWDVPDGGTRAWLQVLGGWSLFFNTWGNLNTFGIFQTYYESGDLFHETSSNIAWIGAIQAFLLLGGGIIAGPLYDRGYLRALLVVGSFCVVFGYMMLSLCKTFWEVVLAQGFLIGIGGSCLFIPAISILPGYFKRHLGMAVGIAASGSSTGGIIYPIVFYRLVDRIGFGWTVRVIGFIALATLLPACLVLKQRVKPAKARAMIDPTAFTDVPFLIFVFGSFLGFISLYVVLFYISYFGEATGYTDQKLSFYLIPILNAASVFGRTLPNIISDYVGTLNIIGPFAIICSILTFCLIAVHSAAGLIVLAAFYGFASGVFIALPPVCIAILTQDKSKIGTRIGMAFGALCVTTLIGGPAAGAIIGANPQDLHWNSAWAFGGACSVAGGCVLIGLRMWRANWTLVKKL